MASGARRLTGAPRLLSGTPPERPARAPAARRRARLAAGAGAALAFAAASLPAPATARARPPARPGGGPIAHMAGAGELPPDDPGYPLQWNFWGPEGIDLPEAWRLASASGAPGGRGAVVAVLDTGVAYGDVGPYRRSPDADGFVPGHDFVDDDDEPLDENGHGTHVAGTIAESTDNGIGAAGIAYGARVMPVRVLDRNGDGDARTISRGIRYAAGHGADIINLSLAFAPAVRAARVGDVLSAIRYARERDVVITAVAGNGGRRRVPYPAAAQGVIAVAATTEHGCAAKYSNSGADVDIAAPGGGPDASPGPDLWDQEHCRTGRAGRSIYQLTFTAGVTRFGLPSGYYGTSMAAPHVAGVAALLIASGRLGEQPTPDAVAERLEATARDIGPAGVDERYGHGLLDAAAALR